ncbi:prolyl oligopeptidase family serine peptidase [Bacillaceae bacterium S4-13-58]
MASKRNTTHVYITVVEIEDWGPAVTKVIIDLGKKIPLNEVKKDTFKVHVTRSDERLSKPFWEEGNRKVSGAYVSDNKGNQLVCGTSNYVAIEMEIGPTIRLGSPMNYDGEGSGYNHWIQYEVTIYQVEDIVTHGEVIKDLIINRSVGEIRKLVDQFQIGNHNSDKKTLTYAEYIPKKGNQQKHPLFIWLHGAGEGGTDPTVAIGGTKVVNFNTEEIQDHLHNAYILVPQTHGFWMEGFIGFGDGTSIYQEALMSLIEEYMASHLDIDPNRIYIGGYSNGGYMTMLMLRDYPDFFAAGLPTCEALRDDLITKKDISNLAKTPIWFVMQKMIPL